MPENLDLRPAILNAIEEWRKDEAGFFAAMGRGPARTVYFIDLQVPVSGRYPLKAIATRVLGDRGDGWTTRRYQAALKLENYGFEVTVATESQAYNLVSLAEADLDAAEGDTKEATGRKRR